MPVLIFTLFITFLGGCADGRGQKEPGPDEQESSGDLAGVIAIDGSTTVFPLSEAIAEEFSNKNPNIDVTVELSFSEAGFEALCNGDIDIADASRRIDPQEAEICRKNGIRYAALEVGRDGIAVMINRKNSFVSCLTTDQLRRIWRPGSTVTKWNDVDPSFPDEPIRLFAPPTGAATLELFTQRIVGKRDSVRTDYTANQDKNVLLRGISEDQYALGFFAFPYYQSNKSQVKLVAVDDGKGCIKPSLKTIASNRYSPLSRPLYIYVSEQSLERAEVVEFVDYYIKKAKTTIVEVGDAPASNDAYAEDLKILKRLED